jgi:hypothetical protein
MESSSEGRRPSMVVAAMVAAIIGAASAAPYAAAQSAAPGAVHVLSLIAWQPPDSARRACRDHPSMNCPVPDRPFSASVGPSGGIRMVIARVNPCQWRAAASWALSGDTLRVWFWYPDYRDDVGCPGMHLISKWEGTTPPLASGRYVILLLNASRTDDYRTRTTHPQVDSVTVP